MKTKYSLILHYAFSILHYYIRTGIEVVITALTRNQVVLTGSWVRIPPCPPRKKLIAAAMGFF